MAGTAQQNLEAPLEALQVSANRYYFLYLQQIFVTLGVQPNDITFNAPLCYLCNQIPSFNQVANALFGSNPQHHTAVKYSPDLNYSKFYENLSAELSSQEFFDFLLVPSTDFPMKFPQSTLEQAIQDLIHAIMVNDNEILDNLGDAIEALDEEYARPSVKRSRIFKSLLPFLDDTPKGSNSPVRTGERLARLKQQQIADFHPQRDGRMPTIPHFAYTKQHSWKQANLGKQLSLGTQVRRNLSFGVENLYTGVDPLWERWLQQQGDANPVVYFNLLVSDESTKNYPKRLEAQGSSALQQAGKTHSNLHVVNIPANGGWMSRQTYLQTQVEDQLLTVKNMQEEMLKAILCNMQGIQINEETWSKIKKGDLKKYEGLESAGGRHTLENSLHKRTIIGALINESTKEVLGPTFTAALSPAQHQAVWMHVTHYQLPRLILEAVNPAFFHFTCKDAIDRGGVASAVFNLMESIKMGKPLTQKEFNTAIHAAALMVKGRGMNSHFNRLWNFVDCYVDGNFDTLMQDNQRRWLIRWRNMHCPQERVPDVLTTFLDKTAPTLDQADELCAMGLVRKAATFKASRRGLLLETATRLVFLPDSRVADEAAKIQKLADQFLATKGFSIFYKIAGALKELIGTLTGNQQLVKTGLAIQERGKQAQASEFARLSTAFRNALSHDESLRLPMTHTF